VETTAALPKQSGHRNASPVPLPRHKPTVRDTSPCPELELHSAAIDEGGGGGAPAATIPTGLQAATGKEGVWVAAARV
jgi:hypothetical protein